MTPPTFRTETALASHVVDWLREMRWEVYQEVQVEAGERIADIVAVQGAKVWILEAKLHLGLEVVEQALGWCGYAHRISVVAPHVQKPPTLVLRELRLGLLTVDVGGNVRDVIQATPRIPYEVHVGLLRDALQPGMKTYAPAGSRGRRWTPYRGTADRLREYVEQSPGVPLRRAVEEIQHHWSSNKVALHRLDRLIAKGRVPGVVSRFEASDLRLYPAEA